MDKYNDEKAFLTLNLMVKSNRQTYDWQTSCLFVQIGDKKLQDHTQRRFRFYLVQGRLECSQGQLTRILLFCHHRRKAFFPDISPPGFILSTFTAGDCHIYEETVNYLRHLIKKKISSKILQKPPAPYTTSHPPVAFREVAHMLFFMCSPCLCGDCWSSGRDVGRNPAERKALTF